MLSARTKECLRYIMLSARTRKWSVVHFIVSHKKTVFTVHNIVNQDKRVVSSTYCCQPGQESGQWYIMLSTRTRKWYEMLSVFSARTGQCSVVPNIVSHKKTVFTVHIVSLYNKKNSKRLNQYENKI